MSNIVSIISLLMSMGAFSVAVLTYRNSKRNQAMQLYAATLDDALEVQMILELLQANLQTLEKTTLRKDFAYAVKYSLERVPKMLGDVEAIRRAIEALPPTSDVSAHKRKLRVLRVSVKTWADKFAYGIERLHNP